MLSIANEVDPLILATYVLYVIQTIVINTVPFRPEWTEFFVPVCKPVPKTPPFHLGPDFGVFWPVSAVPANFSRYVILSKKKKKNIQTTPFWT